MQGARAHRKLSSVSREPAAAEATPATAALGDSHTVDILTTEHWSLLSTRTLGYQETFGRATLFIGVLSAAAVALALVAQAMHFGRQTLSIAALVIPVALLIGVATF